MPITLTPAEQNLLGNIHLPVRPQVLVNIINESKKPEPNMYLISQWISEDIGITAAVLKIVNSPVFARNTNITSIEQAVVLLGFDRVYSIVKSVALKAAIATKHNLTTFWTLSSQIAHTAINIAHFLDKPEYGDSAYLLGLFHISSIPTLLEHFEEYQSIFDTYKEQGWVSISEQEKLKFNTTHITLSACIAQQWELTQAQYEAIYYVFDCDGIFDDSDLSNETLTLLCILKIARRCVFQHNHIENEVEWLAIKDSIESFLHMDEADLEELIFQTEHQFD